MKFTSWVTKEWSWTSARSRTSFHTSSPYDSLMKLCRLSHSSPYIMGTAYKVWEAVAMLSLAGPPQQHGSLANWSFHLPTSLWVSDCTECCGIALWLGVVVLAADINRPDLRGNFQYHMVTLLSENIRQHHPWPHSLTPVLGLHTQPVWHWN